MFSVYVRGKKEVKNVQLLSFQTLNDVHSAFKQTLTMTPTEYFAFLYPGCIIATQRIKCELDFQRLLSPGVCTENNRQAEEAQP